MSDTMDRVMKNILLESIRRVNNHDKLIETITEMLNYFFKKPDNQLWSLIGVSYRLFSCESLWSFSTDLRERKKRSYTFRSLSFLIPMLTYEAT